MSGSSSSNGPSCGGCRGEGPHSTRCSSQPGARYQRLKDLSRNLHREVAEAGDPEAELMAYQLMLRLGELYRISRGVGVAK